MRPLGDLRGVDEVRDALLSLLQPVEAEEVPLVEADGRALAEGLVAPEDVPAFDRSAMDGYAFRAADAGPGARLRVVGRAPAGEPFAGEVPAGCAVEIATGGVLPAGLDAVAPFERVRREGDAVVLHDPARPGDHVSPRGGDVRRGEVVLRPGDALTPARVALAASLGRATVRVRRRPRVAILPSGTEVVEPGRPLPPGAVYDGNAPMLEALARRLGAIPRRLPPVPDREDAFARALREAAADADLVVTTGGSSVGERDLVADTVRAAGEVLAHGVRMKPGRPVLVGRAHGVPVLGLPGYPASAVVTAEVFLVPALRRLAGLPPPDPAVRRARLAEEARSRPGWTLVLPVAVEAGLARPTYKESGTLTSVTGSWGYVLVPEDVERVEAGAEVDVRCWS